VHIIVAAFNSSICNGLPPRVQIFVRAVIIGGRSRVVRFWVDQGSNILHKIISELFLILFCLWVFNANAPKRRRRPAPRSSLARRDGGVNCRLVSIGVGPTDCAETSAVVPFRMSSSWFFLAIGLPLSTEGDSGASKGLVTNFNTTRL